jgi:hypothetical protein
MAKRNISGTIKPDYAFELLIDSWNYTRSSKVTWSDSPERAWLMMDPGRSRLYKERLKTLKDLMKKCEFTKIDLVSMVDKERSINFKGSPIWWHAGHILVWSDQGLDLSTMANLGILLRLKEGQGRLSTEQIEKLEHIKEEIPLNQKEKIIDWFIQEFNHEDWKSKLFMKLCDFGNILTGKFCYDYVTIFKHKLKTNCDTRFVEDTSIPTIVGNL